MGKNYVPKKKYDTISKIDRKNGVLFMVSDEEKARLIRIADSYGISISAYCRLATLNNRAIFEKMGGNSDVR